MSFIPLLDPPGDPQGTSLVFAVRGTRVVLVDGEPAEVVETAVDLGVTGIFLGTLDDRHCWAVDLDAASDLGEDDDPERFLDLYRLWGAVDEPTWYVAGRAVQLVEWQRNHQFCGRCGAATVDAPGERARVCPECKLLAYPRLAPAVIMLLERGDGKALLARNKNFPAGMFSPLAGFVEPGETLEQAVRREILEEVGITVGKVEYRGSQPWPFPHQLMIGFGAWYESGDVTLDEVEIVEANWFSPDEAPSFPPGMSIAGRLIDEWRTRVGS